MVLRFGFGCTSSFHCPREPAHNDPNGLMVETAWCAMTTAVKMFLPKGNWHIQWECFFYAKENATDRLVRVYDRSGHYVITIWVWTLAQESIASMGVLRVPLNDNMIVFSPRCLLCLYDA